MTMRWQRVPTRDLPIREPARETRWALGYALFYSAAAAGVGLLIRAAPAPLWGARMLTLDLWYIVLFKICLLLVVPAVAFYRLGYRAADLLMGWDRLRWRGARLALAYAAGFCLNLGHLSAIHAAAAAVPAAEAAARIGLGVAFPPFMAGLPAVGGLLGGSF
ncbi:MAG: hypothetical protein ACREMV_06275 [Gemmatimonadales bacterium]